MCFTKKSPFLHYKFYDQRLNEKLKKKKLIKKKKF